MKYIKNKISDDLHNFEEALLYYKNDLEECKNSIEDIEDLCEALNSMDIYGCGSSFEIVEKEY